jgi:type I site-specific restriction endonuclease
MDSASFKPIAEPEAPSADLSESGIISHEESSQALTPDEL